MIVTAKYSGRCSRCGQSINPGESIDWVHGGSTMHIKCPVAQAVAGKSIAQAPTRQVETKTCWECGCPFTFGQAHRNGGDWGDSYCGC